MGADQNFLGESKGGGPAFFHSTDVQTDTNTHNTNNITPSTNIGGNDRNVMLECGKTNATCGTTNHYYG